MSCRVPSADFLDLFSFGVSFVKSLYVTGSSRVFYPTPGEESTKRKGCLKLTPPVGSDGG